MNRTKHIRRNARWILRPTLAAAIARLESALTTGKHSPSLNTLRKYAAALGKRVEVHLV